MLIYRDMRAVGRMPPKCKIRHFSIRTGLPQSNLGSQDRLLRFSGALRGARAKGKRNAALQTCDIIFLNVFKTVENFSVRNYTTI